MPTVAGYLSFLVFLVLLNSISCLIPGGKNVKTTYQTYYVAEQTSTKHLTYRRTCTQTCSTHFIWCWSETTVCKTTPTYRWISVYQRVSRTKPVYSCYSGWSPNYRSTECTIPICSGGCKNGGTCVSPSNCNCASGWTGSRCRTDINECKNNRHSCGYKPGCVNTMGSYRCTCSAGYFLMSDNRNCQDINECTSNRHSCGANTRCVNNPGNYTCPCIGGFIHDTGSTKSCTDINECDAASGFVHGCQGTCINMIGTYRCSCPSGHFLASDGRRCTDHDECASAIHGCQQLCVNFPGGYNCSCSAGYRLSKVNQKSCHDVDECSENTAGCAHNCTNEIGSFNCSCRVGYYLGADSKSCNDANECSSGLDHCQHNCINTPGSYKCNCRSGFDLLQNGGDCAGRPCFPIYNPINGVKNCSGYTTEEVCHFGCSPGYDLVGSRNRTCTDMKLWTGEETKCEIIHCPIPTEPTNGFIYFPCNTYFGSQCTMGCASGYFIDGTEKFACDAHRVWQPENITCREIEICRPNPCLHGGTCSAISSTYYSCNCTQTGYIGTKCDIGYITLPDYPTLTPGVPSQYLTYEASPPSDNVVLTLKSRDLEFDPPKLLFKHGTPARRSLKVTGKKTGLHFIQYSLSGPSAGYFKFPDESVVFVKSSKQPTSDNETLSNTIPSGCHKQQVDKCPRSNDMIYASSTFPWVTFGPMSMTSGVVNLEVGATTLPLSLVGTNLMKSNDISSEEDCNEDDSVSYSTEQLITKHLLEKTFLNEIRNSLPNWLQVTLRNDSVSTIRSASELKTNYMSGKHLRTAHIGEGQPIDEETYYSLLTSHNLNLTLQNDVDLLPSRDNKEPLSLAVELCGSLPKNVILRPSLKDMHLINDASFTRTLKANGWDVEFYSLQISKSKSIDMLRKRLLWNSKRFFNIESSESGNLAVVLSLKKRLSSLGFVNSSVKFEGTAVADLDDIDNILDSPLRQEWKLDLYGKIAVESKFKVKGKVTNMILEASEAIGYARFGGKKHIRCYQNADDDLQGLFFTNELKQNPFLGTALNTFVEIGRNKTFSYFLDATIYETISSYEEISNGISIAFNGNLKFGPIRFENLHIDLSIGNLDCSNSSQRETGGVVFKGDYIKIGKTKFGIFHVSENKHLNLLINVGRTKNSSSSGSFQATAKILGIEKWVNVSFFKKGLTFNVQGKMYGFFDANMSCESRLATWENQIFLVDGVFDDRLTKTGLKHSLSHEMDQYAVSVFEKAMRRVKSINETEQRAKRRLEKVMSFEKLASETAERAREEYLITCRRLEIAEQELTYFERAANNYSDEMRELKSTLDGLCPVKHCPDVCQEGVSCTKCYYDIIGKAVGVCPATCFKTEQRRLPPLTEIVLCESQKCTRIHNTNGFFKRLLGKTFGGILKSVLSFGISAVATFLGAPPPLSSALGSGIVQLLDTGRIDETLCSIAKGAITGFIGGPGVKKVFQQYSKTSLREGIKHGAVALGRKGVSKVVSKAISCQREQRDGHWKCHVVAVQCTKDRFQYKYEHTPYTCKQSCEKDTVAKTIEKSCCSTVPCAFLIVNLTCVAENALCKKAREIAMKQLSKTKANAIQILKNFENARQNVSYWTLKKRKDHIKFMAATRSLNTSKSAVYSLRKAYNVSVEARDKKLEILARPLQIRNILNERLSHVAKVKLETIRFKVKASARYQSSLLPIFVTFKINETQKELFTVLDFSNLNASMRSVAKEILSHSVGDLSSVSRRKRSVEGTGSSELDEKLSTLKDYHRQCAQFQNYQQPLLDVVRSLYNLSSEMRSLFERSKRISKADVNITDVLARLNMNLTLASKMGVAVDNVSYVNDFNADLEMSEAEQLHQEAARDGYEPLEVATKLLVFNWFATMEDLFNDSRIAKECSGFDDCLMYMLNSLSDMYSALELPGAQDVRDQIKDIETKLASLTQNIDVSVQNAAELSSEILAILENLTNANGLCGRAPNITKHPQAFTELGEGETLHLACNATGSSLTFRWRFNTEILQDQSSDILSIQNITAAHSGNYTCEVSNYIAKETSIPAIIVVISPPVIVVQPVEYLGVVLFSDDSLECRVRSNNGSISYQWWFKSLNSTKFAPLLNETFSYLNFLSMRYANEGWYYCNVSNRIGFTVSSKAFVRALHFTLAVPAATLMVSIVQSPRRDNTTLTEKSNNGTFEAMSSRISELLSSPGGLYKDVTEERIRNLHPIDCRMQPSYGNKSDQNFGMCWWKFHYLGENTTTNTSAGESFATNARRVINATLDMKQAISELVNATNNGSLSFSFDNQTYFVEKNSLAVQNAFLLCSRGQILVQEDFICVDCPAGHYGDLDENLIAICAPCALGSYQSHSGQTSCTECSQGFTTEDEGSYDVVHCTVICPAGHYGVINQTIGQCLMCPEGTYQPLKGKFECLSCPAGYMTAERGTQDIANCFLETTPKPTDKPTESKTDEETVIFSTNNRNVSPTKEELQTGDGGVNGSLIAGIVVGVVVVIIGFLGLFACRRRKQNSKIKGESAELEEVENETKSKAESSSWQNNPVYSDFDVPGLAAFNPAYESDFDVSSHRLHEEAFPSTPVSHCGMTVFSNDSAKEEGDLCHNYKQPQLNFSNSLFPEVDRQFELKTARVVSFSDGEFGDEKV